jgi:tetratricopeptide (TPR) repeat protein
MTTQEGRQDSSGGPARRRLHDEAYFLDLLGDSHNGLGRHEAAIEAYRQAAEGFRSQGAECSYALCLFKVADSHLSLGEPWHALGYLQACLPLLHELGLIRHETLAREQLAHCQAELTGVRLLGERRRARGRQHPHGHPAPGTPGARPAEGLHLQPVLHNACCRRIPATRVDSCYARDRRTAALADP